MENKTRNVLRNGLIKKDLEVLLFHYCRKMRYIPVTRPFRDRFLYNNYMYMYLGHICEVLGGDTYENLIRNRLFLPLGMTSTKLIKTPSDVQFGDVAKPYNYRDGKFQNGTYSMYV